MTNQKLLLLAGKKKCPKCGITKSIDDFPKNKTRKDGLASRCKECDKNIQRDYQNKNKKIILEKKKIWYYENIIEARNRNKKPERKEYIKKWYKKNSDKVVSNNKKLRKMYPDKFKARDFVNNCVKLGKIPSPKNLKCIRCGNQAKEYHHHNGYTKEHYLDVVPVCSQCHNIIEHPLPSSAIL